MAGAPERRSRRLPRVRRITRGSEIRALLRKGKRSRTGHFDVLDSASPRSFSRAGVVVPRYGHSAVRRNSLKRRLRETVRLDVLPRLDASGAAYDVLVRARAEAYGLSYDELRAELIGWLQRRWPESS